MHLCVPTVAAHVNWSKGTERRRNRKKSENASSEGERVRMERKKIKLGWEKMDCSIDRFYRDHQTRIAFYIDELWEDNPM